MVLRAYGPIQRWDVTENQSLKRMALEIHPSSAKNKIKCKTYSA